jgi:ftsW/rodA/spoVE family cell division protein
MKLDYDFKQYDLRLLFLMIILNTVGIFIVRSAISAESFKDPLVVRQILGSFVGLSMCIGISLFDYRKLCKFSPYIYAASILLLAGVRIYGTASGHGAMRWITVPVLGKIQPAEFVKVALILFFAEYLQKTKEDINTAHGLLLEGLYLLLPVGLVLIQPNLSTAIIMTVIVFAMTYASPLKLRFVMVFLGMAAVVLLLLFYLFSSGLYDKIPILQGYQVQRILTFLKPDENSSGYAQQMYSIMAIGSGMFKGKGLFNHSIFSVKNGNFLVEEDNDFIFAVIGEELGFRGSIIIIILFLLIIIECLIIAYRAKTLSGRLICVGVMAWIGFQTYTNIAVATGLFPNTGITLPFFSRGVSSLLSVYFGFGIVLNVALQRKT